ncbi:nicotinate-nucleotide adenylyltransferase [Thiomicrospira pelophila]|uniref:nicotinate-nucleotide adenylyltransferase n=1 Tax=Thiomicrospira pelophila TaxID=934 RepID=UPI00068F884E|nr:nicotinate-nucleotide adenylyltransferase [Thiomicrospira pelophila]
MQTTRPGEPVEQLIGVYGGTFDPIHYGHLRPALDVLNQLELDHVRFIPCFIPVHRAHPQVSSEQRCRMIELAIANQPNFILDKREIERQGPSFMVDTLRSLKQDFPHARLVLMMGTDAFAKFLSWHESETILELAHLAIMHRPNEPLPSQGALAQLLEARLVNQLPSSSSSSNQQAGQIVEVEVTQLDLSATRLRELLKNGQAVDYLMPPCVINYIKQHQLYL